MASNYDNKGYDFDWPGKIETIATAIEGGTDTEKLLWGMCGKIIDLFHCDRAWLLFPCDPCSPVWEIPIERTVSEYPGAGIEGLAIQMTSDVAEIFQTALDSESPVIYGPGGLPLAENTKSFQVKSQLSMAIYPTVGKPWQFGIHQCSYDRVWTHDEQKLFHLIGVMTAKALGNNLLLHDLLTTNKQLEQRVHERTVELNAEKNFAESLVDTAQVIVLVLDTEGRIVRFNPFMEKLSGYFLAEVQGKDWFSTFLMRKDHSRVRSLFKQAISDIQTHGNINTIVTKNGCKHEIEWYDKTLNDTDGNVIGVLAIGTDITERKQQEERILHQAHFDGLTNLPNRFLSLDRLSQLLSEAQRTDERVAVLFLDLDDFKKVNDTLGHDVGDKLLIEAAERLDSVVRRGDTVGRLGGDEFILLLGGLVDATDASPVVENLLNCFRDVFRIDGRELILTASVGIAVYPDDGASLSELLRNADAAMYHSKAQGRNTYSYFTNAMNLEVSQRLLLEEQLHGALERGEFRVCYQPLVDVNSGSISGVEALLRWNNPALGEVSPIEFIPIAEHTGLIASIGEFVLTEALAMTAKWQHEHQRQLTMAVNLSPRQFRDPNLVSFIEQALQQSGVSGNSLELEITEGVLMSSYAYIDDALTMLSGLGVGIAMDDFGTGYSSLSYLRSYPFNVLKIDRSFINDIAVDLADRELVNATIAMAHGLGLKVVAEGVETKEQLTLLATQGCDFAQGYFFSKPVSASKITEILKTESIG